MLARPDVIWLLSWALSRESGTPAADAVGVWVCLGEVFVFFGVPVYAGADNIEPMSASPEISWLLVTVFPGETDTPAGFPAGALVFVVVVGFVPPPFMLV